MVSHGYRTILRCLGLLGLVFAVASEAHAQNGTIAGRVIGTDQSTISAVQVFLPELGLGSLTNSEGGFSILNVPAGTYQLEAQRLGMTTVQQQVTVVAGETLELEIAMTRAALGLDEIVVTGTAGAARRREVGNTISQINPADLPRLPPVTTDLLRSAAPGVEVTRGAAGVGSGSRIVIRGVNSVSQGNTPIIYIDGVRMMSEGFPVTADPYFGSLGNAGRSANITVSPLDNINPADIERIEIIKGPAATTLYGTEASAGVIQVFTKRGSQGAPVWQVETEFGPSWSRKFGGPDVPYLWLDASPDWLRTGYARTTSASIRGGTPSFQYFASLQNLDETGILPKDEQTKWTTRGNFNFTPVEDLMLGYNFAYSNQDMEHTGTGRNTNALTLNVYRQEANYFASSDPEVISELLDQEILQTVETMTTGGTVTYSPTADFTNRFTVGYDYNLLEARNVRPYGFTLWPLGGVFNANWTKRLLTFDYVGSFGFDMGTNLRNTISWGGQAVGDDTRYLFGWGEDIPGAVEPTVNSAAYTISEETRQKVWNAGFFGQSVIALRDRYFLTLGARVDGNSAFGDSYGLQVYPKASFSWVASDEAFWGEDWGELKVRGAYGWAGRAPDAFDATRTWQAAGWANQPAFVPDNRGNPDLGPEVSQEFEVGFDLSSFSDRFRASFTYYDRTTKDALMSVGGLASTGFASSQLENVGTLANWGTETSLDFGIIQRPSFGWDLGFSLTTSDSEVVDLGGVPPFSALYGSWIEEGLPIGVIFGPYVSNPDEIADPIILDDHVFGRSRPSQIHGISTSFRLPYDIVLSARGEYQGGHAIVANPGLSPTQGARQPLCYPYYVEPENPDKALRTDIDIPAIWRSRCNSAFHVPGYYGWVWDADFFRLRDVSLRVPVQFAFPASVTSATLTLTLANSYLWTKDLPWWDPEVLGVMGVNAAGQGTDNDPMVPPPITFRAGLRISF